MSWLSDELALILRAKYGLVLIVTHEEGRALTAAAEACTALGVNRWVWSGVSGFEGGKSSTTASEALTAVTNQQGAGVLVMVDVLPMLDDDPLLVRQIREFGRRAVAQGKALWMISPRADLPPELLKEATVIDVPLPTSEEL